MSLVRCESGSLCDDDEVKNKDGGHEEAAVRCVYEARQSLTTSIEKISCSRSVARAETWGCRVVLLELIETRARHGGDVGRFKSAIANKKGFGECCSSGETREMAGGMCCRPGCACAVVYWLRAWSGLSEC